MEEVKIDTIYFKLPGKLPNTSLGPFFSSVGLKKVLLKYSFIISYKNSPLLLPEPEVQQPTPTLSTHVLHGAIPNTKLPTIGKTQRCKTSSNHYCFTEYMQCLNSCPPQERNTLEKLQYCHGSCIPQTLEMIAQI